MGTAWRRMALAAALAASALPAIAASTRVVDGDTLEVDGVIYRLAGIDAAEFSMSCPSSDGGTWPCGKEALQALEALVAAGPVACVGESTDQYGRTIAVCAAGGVELNDAMVRQGMAWAFLRYSVAYEAVEAQARAARIGIWQSAAQPPWEYREEQWAKAQSSEDADCLVKGNISDRGRIYHTPWSPYFKRTKIDVAAGERCFADEGEAVAAGWRAPIWGR